MMSVGKGRFLVISVFCADNRATVEAREKSLNAPSVKRTDIPNDLQWLEDHAQIQAHLQDVDEYRQYKLVIDGEHGAFLLVSPECVDWVPRLSWVER